MILFRKAILIIHGFAGGTHDEERLANYLEHSAKFDVYAFTLPGHDKRTFRSVRYTEWIRASEEQIESLINSGYKNIYLIGHSMGGVIASYLAGKYSEVKKVVLAAPAFRYLTVSSNANNLEKLKKGIALIKNNDKDEIITRFLKLPLSSVKEFASLISEYKNSYLNIKVPVLILHGDKDTIVPLKSSQNIYEKMENHDKKFMVLKGITHDIFREVNVDVTNERALI